MPEPIGLGGILFALAILACWSLITGCLFWLQSIVLSVFALPILAHLYTGLFITAHDAMHGTVHSDTRINDAIGTLCSFLFVFNSFKVMRPLHLAHHRYVATDKDPDFLVDSSDFWPWFIKFFTTYANKMQFGAIALVYYLLLPYIPSPILVLSWILPASLATFQLFYFGTYVPHGVDSDGKPADNRFRAFTEETNHLKAFLSCYFFGYHFEHHDQPWLPWWRLWQAKHKPAKSDIGLTTISGSSYQ